MEKYNEDKLLTTQQLAKMLLVNPETLRSWRWKGTHGPKFIKIGYRVRYKMSDVKEYLDNQTRLSTSDTRYLHFSNK